MPNASARRPSEDNHPFWEQDDTRGSHRKDVKRIEKPGIKQAGKDAWQQSRRDDWQKPRQIERYQLRKDEFAARQQGWKPLVNDAHAPYAAARQPQEHEGRKNSRNKPLLIIVLFVLIAIALVVFLNVVRIRSIEVKGDATVQAQSIITLSGISLGENTYMADLSRAKRNIESDPLLEVLGISRVFPDKITIEIRQRKPHGAIACLGKYVVIDEKGFVLDVRNNLPIGEYPLISGISIQPSEKGKPLIGLDNGQLSMMQTLLSSLYDNKALQFISQADLSNSDDIRLLTGEGMEIDLGKPSDLDRKAQWIACTVPELKSHGYTTGVLYITGANNPVYSTDDLGQKSQSESSDAQTNPGSVEPAAGEDSSENTA